jgi:hypothetical protein
MLSARYFGTVVKHYKTDAKFPVQEGIDFVASYSTWSNEQKAEYNEYLGNKFNFAFKKGNEFEDLCKDLITDHHQNADVKRYTREQILVSKELGIQGVPDFVVEDEDKIVIYECKSLSTYLLYTQKHKLQALLYALLFKENGATKPIEVTMVTGNSSGVRFININFEAKLLDELSNYCLRFKDDLTKGNFNINPVERYTQPLSATSQEGVLATKLKRIADEIKYLEGMADETKKEMISVAKDKKMIFDNGITATIVHTAPTIQIRNKEFLEAKIKELEVSKEEFEKELMQVNNGAEPISKETRKGSSSVRFS